MQDRKGVTTTFAYDQANRLTQALVGGLYANFVYDANGNRLTLADPTGNTTYLYDSLDRLTRTTYPDGLAVQAAYDRVGNRISLTNPGGIATAYSYDVANRLIQITQGTLTWMLIYDAAGNRTRLNNPNGTSTIYGYLANNWLSTVNDLNSGGGTFLWVSYTYDANGNRISQNDWSGTSTFTYDALNRLTQSVHPGTYGTWSWTYDAVGNRTQQVAPSGTTGYTYDGNDRLTQAGGTTYSYDANGNLLSISGGRSFTYDAFNQLTQTAGPSGTVTYTYNGDGLKVRRAGPDGVTRYYHDGIRPIWETDDARVFVAEYMRDIFGNLLARREASGARYHYHYDGLGSTHGLTDASANVSATMLYDAWGQVRSNSGSVHGKYRFTGAELDTTTGLYHMGIRFYDTTIGRWTSEDPLQDKPFEPASLNYYAYVYGNPVGNIDPLGTESSSSNNQSDEILERVARRWGISVDELRALIKDAWGWLGSNLDAILFEATKVSGIISAILGLVSIGVIAGLITVSAPALTLIAGAAALVTGSATLALYARGKITQESAVTTIIASGLSALPGTGAKNIAALARSSGMMTTGQTLSYMAWAIGRPFAWVSWALPWRK